MFDARTYKRCMCKGPLVHRRGKLKGQPVVDEDGVQKIGYLGTGCPDLEKRDHGTWSFYIELPAAADGVRKRVRLGGFRTQTEASTECKKVWDQHQAGLDVGVRETVAQFLERWIISKQDLAVSTAAKYTEHMTLHINPYIGHLDRKELRKHHIEAMFASIVDRNTEIEVHREYVSVLAAACQQKKQAWRDASPEDRPILRAAWHEARELLAVERKKVRRVTGITTQHRIRATLSSALEDALRAEEVTKNWAHLVRLPKAKAPKPLLWTPARVARWRETGVVPGKVMVWTPSLLGQFLDAYVDDELFDLFHFMAIRGPRRGEACALPISEIDLDEMQVTISQQVVYVAKKLFGTTPKADSERIIDLDPETARLFADRMERRAKMREKAGAAWVETGFFFTKENGEGYHPDHLTYRFKKMVEDADLPPVTLHGLRHGAACIAHASGAEPKDISEQLGHSGIQITMDTYTTVFEEAKKAQAAAALAVVPRAGRPTLEPATEEEATQPERTEAPASVLAQSGPHPTSATVPTLAPVPAPSSGGRLAALRRAREKKAAKASELTAT
nr:tyrosine-type recombinase/integrase [Kitasatospora sp. Xyl93]